MAIYYYQDGTTEDVHEDNVDLFLEQNPTATLEPIKAKKTNDVAEPGAAVASETTAPESGDSPSESTSSEFPTLTDQASTAEEAKAAGLDVIPGGRQEGDTIFGVTIPEVSANPLTFEEQLDEEKSELETKINNFSTNTAKAKKVLDDFERQNIGEGAIIPPTQETYDEYNNLVKAYNLALEEQDEIAVMASEYESKVEEFNKTGKDQELTAKQSIKNSFSNVWQDGKNAVDYWFGEGIGLDLATDVVYRSVFGDERVDAFIEKHRGKGLEPDDTFLGIPIGDVTEGLLTTEERIGKIKSFEAKQQDRKPTLEVLKSFGEGKILDGAASVLSAIVNVGGSVIYNTGTAGTGYFMDFAAQNYIDYNNEIAESKGKTLEELIRDEEDDGGQAVKLASLQAGAEYFGFSKIKKALGGKMPVPKLMPKKVRDKFNYNPKAKTTLNILTTGKTESATEVFQGAIEEYNKKSATDPDVGFASTLLEYAQSPEGMEAGVQGFVGAGGLATGSYSARAASQARQGVSGLKVETQINELLSLSEIIAKTKDETVRQGLEVKRDSKAQELSQNIRRGNKLYSQLGEAEIAELENIHDIADTQAARAVELQKKFNKKEITEQEYKLALEGYKQSYDDAQARAREIMAAKQTEDVKKKAEELGATVTTKTSEEVAESFAENVALLEAEIEGAEQVLEQGLDPNSQEVQNALGVLNNAPEQLKGLKQADTSYGFISQKADGTPEIIINKDKPKFGTAAHEFLHLVLANTLKGDMQLQDAMGGALTKFVSDKKGGVSQAFIDRMSAYVDKETGVQDVNFGEETITIMSESILDGSLEFNDNLFTKIGDVIRQTARRLGWTDVKFNTGKDVYNFIKDYNASIEKGYTSKAITKVATEGAKGKLITPVTKATEGEQFSKESDASNKVQEIYNEQGEAGLFDILEEFKPITTRIARRFRDVPGYDEQLIIDEIETGKRGIFDLIREYKPESGVPLAAYINKFLPARSIEAGNRILKTEFEEDITEARGVAAEETVEQQPERKTKAKVLADELNIADKVASEVSDANIDPNTLTNFKSVPNAVTNAVGELLGISPAKIKSKANLTKNEVASAQRWFNKNAQLVVDALPQGFDVEGQATGVPRTVLQALYTQKEGRAKTKAGLKGQIKRTNIKNSEFLELVDIIDGKPTRNRNTSARIIALADLLGKTITNQELRKTDPSLARIRSGMSDVMFSKAEGAKTFNMVEKPSDVKIPLVSIQLLKDLLEGKTRTGFRDMEAEFEPGVTFDQKASEIANKFLNQSPEVKSLIENTMTGGVRGGLFLTKPEFNKRIKVKDVKDVSEKLKSYRYNYNSEKRLTKKAVESFNNKDIVADRNARLDILHNFWKDVETYLKDNKQDQWFFEALVRDTSRGQQALTRVLAPFRGYAVDKNGKPAYNLEVVEEHSKPQNNVSYAYLNAAIEGKVDELKPVIEASYMQISLLKTDDKAIAAAGLEQTMPDVYFDVIVPKIKSGELELAPGMAAAVRLAAVGTPYAPKVSDNVIDLNKIYMPELDQTIAQHFGIDKIKDTRAANILLIEELAGVDFENTKLPEAQLSKAISNARPVNMYSKDARGMSTFDFDETLIIEGENFIVATKGDDVQRISSGDWPLLGQTLADEGYSFDFTDFVNVRGGVDGPLLQKMKNQIKKYGTQNVFVLTARPQESATAIHEWLKTKGINIPFENITGLGNSTGDAKAAWFLDKYAEGYNDMYFVDDAMPNVDAVKHVFDQLDIKGKSVQAKIKFSKDLNSEFNKMLERTKGIGAEKVFSRIGAQKRGKNVGRFTFFVPPSADDFAGLLRYFVGKGEQGNKDLQFFNEALIKPFARADRDMKEARQSILDDHKALRKELPQVAKKLGKMVDDSGFTFDNAIRVYLWDKSGLDIPGLAKRDISFLTSIVKKDQDLKTYADIIGQISKQKKGYVEPSEYWNVESIAADLQNVVNKQGRKKFLAEWKENVETIFSPENLNKIEATYGSNYREALENALWRMENGTNRAKGMGRLEGAWNNWVNNSVGAIMFFNARSAVLQTLSTVNFINFEDNNIFAAAKAFANQKQYWKDFSFLFNSDFLKQRRAGLQTNINEAEIASAVAGATNKAKAALQYLLKQGFLPTQIADSFAIASGGSTYYRNRVKKYVKEGMSQANAETQAMEDFMEIAEETQQSARPDRISQQQASSLGRIILAFANTPMQYARLIKKAAGDLTAGRGDWRSNVSRIIYYGAIQNIIFSSLQSAIFALAFDDEEPEQDEIDRKVQRTLNGMIDSLLRGSGLAGAVVSTLKNVINKFIQESEKKSRADYGNVLVDALNVSPPIGSKSRKLYNATKTYKYNREVMGEMNTFDLENPVWDAVGNVVSATTNLPLDRGFRKIDNMKEALNQDNETWQRIFVGLGWDQWGLGIDSRKEVEEAREEIKEKKKEEKKKTQQRCTKIKSDGTRCKLMVTKPKTRCHYHD